MTPRPRIGLLGIMQELYDEMIPDITEHQATFARELAEALAPRVEITFTRPARSREDIDEIVTEYERGGLDGIVIVMLTYAPAMRSVPALTRTSLPLLLANVQPVRTVTESWTMDDLTYNQGVHGAQDQANALARSGRSVTILTGDWSSDIFGEAVEDWARAARTVTRLRSSRVALFGNPMNGMGDILVDPNALLRRFGITISSLDIGELARQVEAVADSEVEVLVGTHQERFEVDPQLPLERHQYAARLEIAIRGMLEAGSFNGFSFHFDSIGGDGRIRQLPLLAASDLMAEGYGFAAEGDVNTATLMVAANALLDTAHFSEIYAMDWERDSVLISHMGEGNWAVARPDRSIRLIDRPLGIGGLENPPTPVFGARPGPATTAALVQLGADRMRLVVGLGVILDTAELPRVEMHHFHFRPCAGMQPFMDRWLSLGAPHHFVTSLGDDRGRWRALAETLGLEYVEI